MKNHKSRSLRDELLLNVTHFTRRKTFYQKEYLSELLTVRLQSSTDGRVQNDTKNLNRAINTRKQLICKLHCGHEYALIKGTVNVVSTGFKRIV